MITQRYITQKIYLIINTLKENFSSNEVNLKDLEIPKYSFCIFKSGKNK